MPKLPAILRELFNTHGELPAREQTSPLFITGAMRSGTTYLVNQLAAHPQLLKIGAELNQVWTSIGGASMLGHCEYRDETHASPEFTYQMTRYIADYIHASRSSKRHLMRLAKQKDTNLFRVNYDWDALVPVNKSPHLMNKTRYVHALFPSSKVILIVRDIYAQSASLKHHFMQNDRVKLMPADNKACWSIAEPDQASIKATDRNANVDFKTIPLMWLRLNEMALKDLKKLPREQVHVIAYESLMNDPENGFEDILSFLKLKPIYRSSFIQRIREGAKTKNTTTSGDPLTKWKKNLSQKEIAMIEEAINENQESYSFIQQELMHWQSQSNLFKSSG